MASPGSAKNMGFARVQSKYREGLLPTGLTSVVIHGLDVVDYVWKKLKKRSY